MKKTLEIKELTPRQIVAELDKYIIGQNDAKKSVAIALRNRWRRRQVTDDLREEILPNNIILIGPTGVGKTEISRRLARLAGAPFIKVEASKFTEVGYVGRDVESMVRDLIDIAIGMLKTEKKEGVKEKAEDLAKEKLLDLLIPPVRQEKRSHSSIDEDVEEQRLRTRTKMEELLEAGKLEDRMVELDVPVDKAPMMQIFGPIGMEEMGINLQDIMGSAMPKKMKKRKMTVKEAREHLIQEEADKLIDMEDVVKESIERVEESGIVFLDEIDKIAGTHGSSGPDVSREGVQRDILPIVEGTTVVTKHGMVKTDHILFIAAGAFHVSKPSDLIPELQGRFPIRVELRSLTADDFVRILTEPKNALIKQYTALLETEGVAIKFEDKAIRQIAEIASTVNERDENIGARRLHTVLTTLLEDLLFDVPDIELKETEITEEMVQEKLDTIVKNEDLSRYIL